jgi:hypothetical protein
MMMPWVLQRFYIQENMIREAEPGYIIQRSGMTGKNNSTPSSPILF